MKEKDREWRNLKAVEMAKIREEDTLKEAEKCYDKERVKKYKQRYANKIVKEAGVAKLNPTNEKKN